MRNSEDRRLKLYRGVWCVVWVENGVTKRASLRTKDRPQAERNFQEYLRQVGQSSETVSEILDIWEKEKSHLKSIDSAKRRAKNIRKFFGNLKPEQITRKLCKEYKLSRKVADTTIRNELSILRCALRWHDKNTPAEFDLPPEGPPRENYITPKQYKKLLEATSSPHMKLFITMAWGTAARSNAILGLTWDRVDFERKMIDFGHGEKNKRRAKVPMTNNVYEALIEAHTARTCEYVIEYGSQQVKSIRKGFKLTADRAGLIVSPHDLRRSAAICMAESGVPMEEIAQFLGHTNTAITYRAYARYSPDYLRKAASALDI